MAKDNETLEILLDYEKDTKNKVRFTERHEDKEPVIDKLYLNKKQYERLGKPEAINVTIRREQ